jgi:hypothetical protein
MSVMDLLHLGKKNPPFLLLKQKTAMRISGLYSIQKLWAQKICVEIATPILLS